MNRINTLLIQIISILLIVQINAQNEIELRTDGIVIPRIDTGSIISPSKGQVVYDTIIGKPLIYSGASWYIMGTGHKLDAADGSPSDVVFVDNDGNVGIGMTNPTNKLVVDGQIKITGGSPGAGKVLISDADGLATWSNIEVGNSLNAADGIPTNAVWVGNNGDVGIGTTNPSDNLDVIGSSEFNGPAEFNGQANVNGTFYNSLGNIDYFILHASGNKFLLEGSTGNISIGHGIPSAQLDVVGNTELNGNLDLSGDLDVDANTLFVESSSNEVGIGTSTPSKTLDVVGGTELNGEVSVKLSGDDFNIDAAQLFVDGSTGNVGINTALPNHQLAVNGNVYFYSGNVGIGATPSAFAEVNVSTGSSTTGILIQGSNEDIAVPTGQNIQIGHVSTANGIFSEKLRIDGSGNVGIGTTAPANLLDVDGDIRVGSNTNGCVRDGNGTIIAGTCSSDERLKKNILPLQNMLSSIIQLQPVVFQWRSDVMPNWQLGDEPEFGLIAQETEKVFPDMVINDDDGYKRVIYQRIPIMNLQAIKELVDENQKLKDDLVDLKSTVAYIKKTLFLMEAQ